MHCPNCTINLSLRQFKCPLCRNYTWRLPHIVIGVVLLLITAIGTMLTVDYLAANQVSEAPKQKGFDFQHAPAGTAGSSGSANPGRSNPGQPRPASKRH